MNVSRLSRSLSRLSLPLKSSPTSISAPLYIRFRSYSSSHGLTAPVTNVPKSYPEAKQRAMTGPRFEQVDMEAQPNPLPAMELIAQQPVRKIHGRVAVCDGGGGALGHPKVYINLDQPGAHDCGYCGLRFEQEHHH